MMSLSCLIRIPFRITKTFILEVGHTVREILRKRICLNTYFTQLKYKVKDCRLPWLVYFLTIPF